MSSRSRICDADHTLRNQNRACQPHQHSFNFHREMPSDPEMNPEKKFVPVVLPWLIAAGGLVLYLATLNHWVSLSGLLAVSRISGWNWQPELFGPLYWLLTYPIRW